MVSYCFFNSDISVFIVESEFSNDLMLLELDSKSFFKLCKSEEEESFFYLIFCLLISSRVVLTFSFNPFISFKEVFSFTSISAK